MELKVWVDGTQRVVCGITELTTVQEVVIALAQATGRTGRYTLVEKWRKKEKMLPPSEHPLQVLAKWGDQAGDVHFLLKRTGASSFNGESTEDSIIMPERSLYRQSLPPQLKHRQKNEAILNRKEPKRKSLTHTGSSNDSSISKQKEMFEDKNNVAVKKKAIMPPPYRNQTITSKQIETPSTDRTNNSPTKAKPQPNIHGTVQKFPPVSPKKKALLPPPLRKENALKTASSDMQRTDHINAELERKTSSQGINSLQQPPTSPHQPAVNSKTADTTKARAEFTRLVFEQHEHVNEQIITLKSLDSEMGRYEATLQRQERSSTTLKKEIESLEQQIQRNETDLYNEPILEGLVEDEKNKGFSLSSEISKYQSDLSSVTTQMTKLEKRLNNLQEDLEREKKQKIRIDQDTLTRSQTAHSNVKKMNTRLRNVVDEVKSLEERISECNQAVCDKNSQLEYLNRQLRQVNLQQFIRQTGSKVTVLPSDAGKSAGNDSSAVLLRGNNVNSLSSTGENQSDSGGVWV